MSFPTPWTVEVLPFLAGSEDDQGNPVDSWATSGTTQAVYGWAPAGTNESNASRHTVTADVELFAPSDFSCGPRDRVKVDGRVYEVEGDVEDFDHGPFGFQPGVRVNLRRF